MNLPPKIASVLARAPALLPALRTTINVEGLEDLLEVMTVESQNERIIAEAHAREAERNS